MPEDGGLPDCSRPENNGARTRLGGVARDVENGLDELLAIAYQIRQAWIVVALDHDAEFRLHQAAHAFQDLVHAERLDARRAVRSQHAVHQRLQPVGFLDDDLRVLAQLRPFQLALEELRRAAQAAERVLDLVREIADQLAVRLLAGHDALLAREAQLLLDRAQLREQRQPRAVDSRDDAGKRQRLVSHARVGHVLRGVIPMGCPCLTKRGQERFLF
jgi:hypothetical protein